MTIEAEKYRETRAALAEDPIIQALATELPPDWRLQFTHGGTDDQPNYNFMCRALDEYKRRGGTIKTHIGGPAEAVIAVRKKTLA